MQGIIQTSAREQNLCWETLKMCYLLILVTSRSKCIQKISQYDYILDCITGRYNKLQELLPLVCVTDSSNQDKNDSSPGEGLVPTPTAQLTISGLKSSMLTKIQMKSGGTIPDLMINFTDSD